MTSDSSNEPPSTPEEMTREALMLGHIANYNFNLLARALVFSAIYANIKSTRDAVSETNAVIKSFQKTITRQKR